MYVNAKPLLCLGAAFWALLCYTDLLGDCTWKKYSQHVEDILMGHQKELVNNLEPSLRNRTNLATILWNGLAFLSSLIVLSMLRSFIAFFMKILKIKKNTSDTNMTDIDEKNCKILYKNPAHAGKHDIKRQENIALIQEHINLCKQIEELKKDKGEMIQQLNLAQKDNLTARQQIEEYKLETFMMKEKLQRTANSLKENLKYKDFACANHEMITRKAHCLEVHLRDVTKDRDVLRNKVNVLEKNCAKLEDKLKTCETIKEDEDEVKIDELPMKENQNSPRKSPRLQAVERVFDLPEPDVDMSKFQKKIMELQKGTIHTEAKPKTHFDANSKISMDLEAEIKEQISSSAFEDVECPKKPDINMVKQNLLNYSAYKIQMLRPRLKLSENKEIHRLSPSGSTSSTEDMNSPQRLISSTAEFQNFLKSLTGNNMNFNKNAVF